MDQPALLAEAYRRNLLGARTAAYEAAVARGQIHDPYVAARIDARSNPWGAVNGAAQQFTNSIPFLSEAGAGLQAAEGAIGNVISGRPANFGGQWTAARAAQAGHADQFQADHPILANTARTAGLGAQVAGALATGGFSEAPAVTSAVRAATPGFRAAAGRILQGGAKNALTGAVIGGVNGAAQPGTLAQRVHSAAGALLPGAAVGVAAPVVLGAGRAALDATLDAVDGSRLPGEDALNRAEANRALAPIKETLPADVNTGNDAVAHVQSRLQAADRRANSLIPLIVPDQGFLDGLKRISVNAALDLPPDSRRKFVDLAKTYLDPLLRGLPYGANPANGVTLANRTTLVNGSTLPHGTTLANGSTIQAIKSQIDKSAADLRSSDDGYERLMGDHLNDLSGEVAGLADRYNPDFMAAKRAIDAGWSKFAVMRDAASQPGATNGVFSPAQHSSAVQAQDNRQGVASLPYLTMGRGVANAFAAADPAATLGLLDRARNQINAISARPIQVQLPSSITTLGPAAIAGSQNQDQSQTSPY